MCYKVSVIVPVYNVERYIKECLDSLISQSYKNIEIILIDDGSIDNSGQICDVYASKYNNLKVIHKDNEGLGFARNTGLKNASGDFIMFMDSDDYLDSDLIEVLVDEIKSFGADVCKSGFRRITNKKDVISETCYQDEFFDNKESVKFNFLPRIIGSSPNKKDSFEPSCCASLYRAKIFTENKIRFFSERQFISEDLIFNLDYLLFSYKVRVISKIGYNYRINLNSLTKSYRKDRFEKCKYFHQYLKKWLISKQFSDSEILRLDRMFFIYLKMCISQEKYNKLTSSYKNVKNICSDSLVKLIINNYPVNKLGIKQRLFILFIKNRFVIFLLLVARLGLLQ